MESGAETEATLQMENGDLPVHQVGKDLILLTAVVAKGISNPDVDSGLDLGLDSGLDIDLDTSMEAINTEAREDWIITTTTTKIPLIVSLPNPRVGLPDPRVGLPDPRVGLLDHQEVMERVITMEDITKVILKKDHYHKTMLYML